MTENCYVCCRPIVFEARHPWRAPCGRAKARPICILGSASGTSLYRSLFQTKLSDRVDVDGELMGLETQRDND
jgi:hypothetical protein